MTSHSWPTYFPPVRGIGTRSGGLRMALWALTLRTGGPYWNTTVTTRRSCRRPSGRPSWRMNTVQTGTWSFYCPAGAAPHPIRRPAVRTATLTGLRLRTKAGCSKGPFRMGGSWRNTQGWTDTMPAMAAWWLSCSPRRTLWAAPSLSCTMEATQGRCRGSSTCSTPTPTSTASRLDTTQKTQTSMGLPATAKRSPGIMATTSLNTHRWWLFQIPDSYQWQLWMQKHPMRIPSALTTTSFQTTTTIQSCTHTRWDQLVLSTGRQQASTPPHQVCCLTPQCPLQAWKGNAAKRGWRRRGLRCTAVNTPAASRPTPRAHTSRHTCALTQVRTICDNSMIICQPFFLLTVVLNRNCIQLRRGLLSDTDRLTIHYPAKTINDIPPKYLFFNDFFGSRDLR